MARSLANDGEPNAPNQTSDTACAAESTEALTDDRPEYLKVLSLCKVVGCFSSCQSQFVGHRLLRSCAFHQMSACDDQFGLQSRKRRRLARSGARH